MEVASFQKVYPHSNVTALVVRRPSGQAAAELSLRHLVRVYLVLELVLKFLCLDGCLSGG